MAKLRKKTLILAVTVATAITAAALVMAFSPYEYDKSFGYSLVQHSVVIKAPAEALYRYLGNSANASEWSGFVDHITPPEP